MSEASANGAPLVLCVPSKGRLQENADAFFTRAGLDIVRGGGARDYRGTLDGLEGAEIAFLSAGEIVRHLAGGTAHMGVTGEDLIRETLPDPGASVALLAPLGFGYADVVVAVPKAWIDVFRMGDLADVAATFRARRGTRMRVATKYIALTRDFFARHGVVDYQIVESLGATEGAPAAGTAELIVDITTTGATLRANGLKVLDDGTILRSQANLVASLKAPWGEAPRALARKILARIVAEETARTTRQVSAAVTLETDAQADAARLFSARASAPATWTVSRENVPAFADWLVERGARDVAVGRLDYLFRADNPLFDALLARLD